MNRGRNAQHDHQAAAGLISVALKRSYGLIRRVFERNGVDLLQFQSATLEFYASRL